MSAILLVWQILLVSLSLFSFPEERRGLDVASAVCCRDLASGAADSGLAGGLQGFREAALVAPSASEGLGRGSHALGEFIKHFGEDAQGFNVPFILCKALASSPWHCRAEGFGVACGGSCGLVVLAGLPLMHS